MKKKIFLDIIMFIVFIILMFFNFTGVLLHEILGIALFVLNLIHIYLNRRFLFGIKLNNPNINNKTKLKFIIDWLMLIGMTAITITGIGNSRDIFNFINFDTGRWHLYLSYIELFLMLLHFSLNLKLVYKTLKLKNINQTIIFTILVFTTFFGYMFYKDFIKKDEIIEDEESINNTDNVNNSSNNTNTTTVKETLSEYLGKLRCDGCSRHCLLSAPRCGIGENKAVQATQDYYVKYNITETSNSISYKVGDYELVIKL